MTLLWFTPQLLRRRLLDEVDALRSRARAGRGRCEGEPRGRLSRAGAQAPGVQVVAALCARPGRRRMARSRVLSCTTDWECGGTWRARRAPTVVPRARGGPPRHRQEEALYHCAVAELDRGGARASRRAVMLLRAAAGDGHFPQARELLQQVESRSALPTCRCRRGLRPSLGGRAQCARHGSRAQPRQPSPTWG